MFRYLNPTDHHPAKIRKIYKNFKDIRFPIKIRDVHKFEKNKAKQQQQQLLALVFLVTKMRKNIHSMFQRILSKAMLSYY